MKRQCLKEILEIELGKKEEIIFAYLFGSRAKENYGKLSDVDIAIYLNREKMPKSSAYGYISELIVELEEALGEKVDVIILNESSLFLCYNVIKEGIIIMCRSEEERALFHFCVVRDYLDFKPFIETQNYYLKERLRKGSFGGTCIG